jgi:hypothetical protein
MYSMSYNTAWEVGTDEFRRSVSAPKLRDLLSEHPVVAVGRYARDPAAVVLDPEFFSELAQDRERLEELRTLLPLLVAAMSTGAALPSATLRQLGVDLADESWQTLNELQYRLPVRIGYDENGAPVARGELTSAGYAPELDEELVVVDD